MKTVHPAFYPTLALIWPANPSVCGARIMTQHTQGEWTVCKGRHTPEIRHLPSNNTLAKMHATSNGDMMANSYLMAAAPKLLAALEILAKRLDGNGEPTHAEFEQMVAAIAVAKGAA